MTTIEQLYTYYIAHPLISTDTRNITPRSIFFALKGENFDANTFAEKAIEAGAGCAVIDNPVYQLSEKFLLVEDVLTALQQLARHHRQQLTIPVIGLTGTNGKTTTKELINAVLSQQFKVLATQGNLNNHIGVPLTILSINETHEIAVIEMGANHQREIAFLCGIAQPTHGLITNVGKAHLEGFGGVEGVKKGKGELYDFFREVRKSESPEVRKTESREVRKMTSQGEKLIAPAVFVDSDSQDLMQMQQERNLQHVIFYGNGNTRNLVKGSVIENAPLLKIEWENSNSANEHQVSTQLTGAYNLDNILCAICIGVYFEIEEDKINAGVAGYQPKNNRSQILKTESNTLICDFYNANPSSMFAAIENIGNLTATRKVLILGDMFEMGDEAAAEHEAVIKKAMDALVDERIFIGNEFYDSSPEVRKSGSPGEEVDGLYHALFFKNVGDAIIALQANPVRNSTVLIKGSRGMALERLVGLL